MDRKIILKPGETYTISINRKLSKKSSAESRIAEPSKGIIKSRQPHDYLKRRIKPDGLINFYDLGEYFDDDQNGWIDDERRITPTLAELNAHRNDAEFDAYVRDRIKAQLNKPLIFSPLEWKTKFKKIGYEIAEKYSLRIRLTDLEPGFKFIDRENELWTEKGYKFDKKERLEIFADYRRDKETNDATFYVFNPVFYPLRLPTDIDLGYLKVTAAPDYDAPEISFARSVSKSDVYLNRQIYNFFSTIRDPEDGEIFYRTLNAQFLSLSKPLSIESPFAVVRSGADSNGQRLFGADATRMSAHIEQARELRQNFEGDGSYSLAESVSALYLNATDDRADFRFPLLGIVFPGLLIAAINQGAKWFYVWSK